jgi:hypothetical protein
MPGPPSCFTKEESANPKSPTKLLAVAARNGDLAEVKRLVIEEGANVNSWHGYYKFLPVEYALFHPLPMVNFFLSRPELSLECLNSTSRFNWAGMRTDCQIRLVADPRVDVAKWIKSESGQVNTHHHPAIKMITAAGRLTHQFMRDHPIERPRGPACWTPEYYELYELYRLANANPAAATQRAREILRHPASQANSLFTMVVAHCDGVYRLNDRLDKQLRFLNIMRRLPMELQMMVCHRVYGSFREAILPRDVESGLCIIRDADLVASWKKKRPNSESYIVGV